MVQAVCWFTAMSALVKLAGRTLPIPMLVFARGCVTLALSALMLWRAGISPAGTRTGLLLLRGIFGSSALICFYAAVDRLPLAEATVVHQTSPLFTALLAAWLLRERLEPMVLVATVICLGGVLLIAQPQTLLGAGDTVGTPALDWRFVGVGLLGSVLSAFAYVTVRRLGRSEHPLVVVFYFPVVTVVASAPFAIAWWVWPTPTEWLLLVGIGVVTQFGQLALTRGLTRAPAGRAMAVGYLQIALATIAGVILFDTIPNGWSIAGMALIAVGLLGNARQFRRPASPTPVG
ncbi:MAG: DMT family transporter [Planctomycetes bacterium]|nr:DMT family transporter [Planctomycetota bacterium]